MTEEKDFSCLCRGSSEDTLKVVSDTPTDVSKRAARIYAAERRAASLDGSKQAYAPQARNKLIRIWFDRNGRLSMVQHRDMLNETKENEKTMEL